MLSRFRAAPCKQERGVQNGTKPQSRLALRVAPASRQGDLNRARSTEAFEPGPSASAPPRRAAPALARPASAPAQASEAGPRPPRYARGSRGPSTGPELVQAWPEIDYLSRCCRSAFAVSRRSCGRSASAVRRPGQGPGCRRSRPWAWTLEMGVGRFAR